MIFALATTLPEESVMVPLIDPVSSCASAGRAARRRENRARRRVQRFAAGTEQEKDRKLLRINCRASRVIAGTSGMFEAPSRLGLITAPFHVYSNRLLCGASFNPLMTHHQQTTNLLAGSKTAATLTHLSLRKCFLESEDSRRRETKCRSDFQTAPVCPLNPVQNGEFSDVHSKANRNLVLMSYRCQAEFTARAVFLVTAY